MLRAVLALVGVTFAGSPAAPQPLEGRLKAIQETATVRYGTRGWLEYWALVP